jgi:hypothetical protein
MQKFCSNLRLYRYLDLQNSKAVILEIQTDLFSVTMVKKLEGQVVFRKQRITIFFEWTEVFSIQKGCFF